MIQILNFINGEHTSSLSGEKLNNINPSSGKVYSTVENSNAEDVKTAIKAAKEAFPLWKNTPLQKRISILRKIAKLIKENHDELVIAESTDNGKPVSLASHVDIPRAATNFEFYCDAVSQFSNDAFPMDDMALNYTVNEPLGVVGIISPWNLPLYLFTWKIAPAILMGNTVVAKPSEVTPMTAFMLSKICNEAGLPKGVLNIINGEGNRIGEALISDKDVKAISFTGSTATGKVINQLAAPFFKKVSLEMGGKNPNIIFSDCNYEETLKTTIQSSFANQGQICLCGSRIYIQRSIYEKFKSDFVEKAKRIFPKNPLDPNSKMGAIVSEQHFNKVMSCIKLAKDEGGTILTGGESWTGDNENEKGFFILPTIIEGLPFNCKTNQEEIFGPVVTISPFDTEDEIIDIANSTEYGLSTTIWTQDLNRAHNLARQIDTGIVWINSWLLRDLRTPFGGSKSSGMSREGGKYALNFFSEPKNICIKLK